MGECYDGCMEQVCRRVLENITAAQVRGMVPRPSPRLLPFSVLFPKLRKIVVVEAHNGDESKLTEMAQLAGATDWKAFVKMRERSDAEVVRMPAFWG